MSSPEIKSENNSSDELLQEKITSDIYNRRFYKVDENSEEPFLGQVKKGVVGCSENIRKKTFLKKWLIRRLPIIQWLIIEYKIKRDLLSDVISGFTVGIMNLPQSMAYALLANLRPVNGLYISFFPLLMYTLLGTSKQLAIGAIAVVSLLTGEVVQDMSDAYKNTLVNVSKNATDDLVNKYKIEVACSLAFFVGVIQLAMGITGLGMITKYFSDSFISGYTSGSAVHVAVSQIKDIFGFKNTKRFNGIFKIPLTLYDLAKQIPSTNTATLIVSVICIAYLVVFKEFINPRIKRRIKVEFPSELLLVIFITLASYYAKLNANFGIDVVKQIPTGLPSPVMPDLTLWGGFVKNAILISLISFSINISLATLFARKHKYAIESTQELYGYGTANIFGSFFSCFPSAGSLSRSMLLDSSGGKTQIASLFSSLVILVVILWLGPLFEPLPKACLASVILVALKGLMLQCKDSVRLWKINKYEGISWVGTFLSVVLLDVDIGLFIGVLISIYLVIVKDQNFRIRSLSKYQNSTNYVDKDFIKIDNDERDSKYKILRVQRSLYFANITTFIEEIYEAFGINPINAIKSNEDCNNSSMSDPINEIVSIENGPNKPKSNTTYSLLCPYLLLDFSAVNYLDSTAVNAIEQLINDYEKINVDVLICEPQEGFVRILNKMKLLESLQSKMFVTINDAVTYIANQSTATM